jgi:hypothetical protein
MKSVKNHVLRAATALEMNVLHCLKQDIDLFWSIATSPVQSILHALNETHVPKAVQRGGIEIDSIEKSLWIL